MHLNAQLGTIARRMAERVPQRLRGGLSVPTRTFIGAGGAVGIVAAQLRLGAMDAKLFSLLFWCVTVMRFLGTVPSVFTIAVAAVVGNIYLLEPGGTFSLAGQSGVLTLTFVALASMCAYWVASIRAHVDTQRALVDAQRALRERAEQALEENRSLADALGRAVTARDTFLAVAGHELKSPVTGLMLQSQVWQRRMAKRVVTPDELRAAWARQSEALARLAGLVDELLDISRINGGQLQLNQDETDLGQLTQEVLGRFAQQASAAGCELALDAPDAVVGQWDRMRLEQVVGNLLSNALKYGAGAPVQLRIEASEQTATLTVRDHGKGISAADRERIFERFERVRIESHVEGLGLGLWIVREIVDASGGRIRVQSVEGAGTQFQVTLPLQPPAPTRPPRPALANN